MSLEVSILMFGDESYRRMVDDIGDRGSNLIPILTWVRDQMIDINEEQFDTEGKRSGMPWDQLARDTVFSRTPPSDHPILVDKGDLLDAVLTPTNYTVHSEGVEFEAGGEAEEYGRFHQTGTEKMPQRKIVHWKPTDKAKFTRGINRWIMEGILP